MSPLIFITPWIFAASALFLLTIAVRASDFDVCNNENPTRILQQGDRASPQSLYCLGFSYATGKTVQKDMDQALTHYRKAAARGYAPAQAIMGLHYERGMGVKQDYAEALKWYKKAGDQGHPGALNNIGRMYRDGVGVKKDDSEAIKWYRLAADHGSPEAQNNLTAMKAKTPAAQPGQDLFEEGKKLYKAGNHAAAIKPFMKAAEMGNAWAQLQIGSQYEFGEGLSQNFADAVKWYAKAANQGNSVAQKNLGQMYEEGKGVRENWVEAAQWYRKSADQNYANGQFALGRAYQFGIGVPQNRTDAIGWFQRAGKLGHAQAAYFARDLRLGNFIGFRDDAEHNAVIGGKLRFGLVFQEPVGMLFHNSGERLAYIQNLRKDVDITEARTMWNISKSEYDNCQRASRENCHDPGAPPR
jgi:TPR repeat protein